MADKIRLGLIGASVTGTWSARSHLPALQVSPDVELTAVCTTKAASAEAARQAYGARLAFDDYHKMIASPEIDAVAVVVRVPSHYAPTKAALEAGKHVYCEWPLGRTTAEAVELAALAQAKKLVTAVGLQARVNPTLLYMKEQLEAGFVGEIMAVHVSLIREGVLSRPSPPRIARANSAYIWPTLSGSPAGVSGGATVKRAGTGIGASVSLPLAPWRAIALSCGESSPMATRVPSRP